MIIALSFFSYSPPDVVVIGPEFHDKEYFEEELVNISKELNIRIQYILSLYSYYQQRNHPQITKTNTHTKKNKSNRTKTKNKCDFCLVILYLKNMVFVWLPICLST